MTGNHHYLDIRSPEESLVGKEVHFTSERDQEFRVDDTGPRHGSQDRSTLEIHSISGSVEGNLVTTSIFRM